MDNKIIRISVLVICYKQEKLIHRSLDSLIAQKDYLYEVCVNDDASPDGTYNVLMNYAEKYPEFIKPYQNNPNLGIFQNTEAVYKRATGNLIYMLAGDDEVPIGFFKSVVEFIKKNNLNCDCEKFCIYGDSLQKDPDGNITMFSNKMVVKHDALKLKLRQLVTNRGACISCSAFRDFVPVSNGRSYIVELAQDCQWQLFSHKNYHIPTPGHIYYSDIGISTNIPTEEKVNSAIMIYDYCLSFLESQNICVDKKDRYYIMFMKNYRRLSFDKRIRTVIKVLWYYLKSIDISIGKEGLQLNRFLYVLKKKVL